jgi:hypothetical protein
MSDLSGGLFLEPTGPTGPTGPAAPATALRMAHHPQATPTEYLCTCGKIREACVHDEIRAFWSAVVDPEQSEDPAQAASPRNP